MIAAILSLFRCAHKLTFPQAPVRRVAGVIVWTGKPEVACTRCGRRWVFSWETMQQGAEIKPTVGKHWLGARPDILHGETR